MKTSGKIILIVLALALVGLLGWRLGRSPSVATRHGSTLHVVAAENFWGSLVSQLGGSKVSVTSVVSDPNADPHEYESSTTTARAFASADYVIINGAGYDSWGDKLLSASPHPGRKVLNVANLLGKKDGDNPHFWYNPAYVNEVVAQMEQDLINLDPANAAYFREHYATLQASLKTYQTHIASIAGQFGGTKVAATEDIFAYLADAAHVDLVSPPAFTQAVAEGNDPPAASVVQFEQQLGSGEVKVLVYNEQTITPLTDSMKKLAASHHIPIVGITETLQPPNASFQDWMNAELTNLETALQPSAGAK